MKWKSEGPIIPLVDSIYWDRGIFADDPTDGMAWCVIHTDQGWFVAPILMASQDKDIGPYPSAEAAQQAAEMLQASGVTP